MNSNYSAEDHVKIFVHEHCVEYNNDKHENLSSLYSYYIQLGFCKINMKAFKLILQSTTTLSGNRVNSKLKSGTVYFNIISKKCKSELEYEGQEYEECKNLAIDFISDFIKEKCYTLPSVNNPKSFCRVNDSKKERERESGVSLIAHFIEYCDECNEKHGFHFDEFGVKVYTNSERPTATPLFYDILKNLGHNIVKKLGANVVDTIITQSKRKSNMDKTVTQSQIFYDCFGEKKGINLVRKDGTKISKDDTEISKDEIEIHKDDTNIPKEIMALKLLVEPPNLLREPQNFLYECIIPNIKVIFDN